MKGICLWLLLISLAIMTRQSAAQEAVYFDAENIIRFANHLYQRGDFVRAAGEYQRAFYVAGPDKSAWLEGRIGRSLLMAGRLPEAQQNLKNALNGSAGAQQDSLRLALATSHFLMGAGEVALLQLDSLPELPVYQSPRVLFKTFDHLHHHRWDLALRELQRPTSIDSVVREELRYLAESGRDLPQKSPALAAALSTIVPGSGKWYTGRKADGLYSLLLIGGSGWLAWEGFDEDGAESVKGWIFATTGSVFYLGNIYGSAVSARLFNHKQLDGINNAIAARLDLLLRF